MTGPDRDPLLAWREEFPSLDRTLHFASHTLGAMPRGVEHALDRYVSMWRSRGIRSWEEEWFALPTEVGTLLGTLFGAEPGSIAMFENVTSAESLALSAIDFTPPRNRLVCTEEDFPSLLYLYEGLARRGIEVVRVPAREGRRIDEQDVIAAIDERVAVVAISHVMFRTSQVLDLAPIAARARAAGALTMIDAYQAIGTVPLDVRALELDLLAGGSVKWLCGGPGAGYLYVSPRVAPAFRPAITGWLAHAQPFAFDTGPMRYDEGPRRFWTGTPAVPAFAAAREGYKIVAGAGIAEIRVKSLRQTARIHRLADEYGMRVGSPREDARRGGTVALDLPNADRVCAALLSQDVLLDFRPGVGLRLAPHFYTRDDEIDEVMRRVRDESRKAG
jgi:kynureninase